MLLNGWTEWKVLIKVVERQVCKAAISNKADEDSPVLFAYSTSKELSCLFEYEVEWQEVLQICKSIFPGAHNANQFVDRCSSIQPPQSISFSQCRDFLSF